MEDETGMKEMARQGKVREGREGKEGKEGKEASRVE